MEGLRARLRRGAVQASVLVVTAGGLGLVVTPTARASCAGPQLALEQGGAPVPPRRVGEGESEEILYDVTRDQPLRVNGSNLTFDCHDTHSANQRGCGAPIPDPIEPIEPVHDPELVLTQRDRSWTLARVGTISPDLTTRVEVTLPSSVRPGHASLSLVESRTDSGAQLELVIA